MTILQGIALFVAALLAGALNSVAGGGSLISFPTLLFVGIPSIPANATNTVSLWPGLIASIGAYRRELADQRHARLLGVISLVGGVIGAWLLLHTSEETFDRLVPYLLLLATLLFTFGNTITRQLQRIRGTSSSFPLGGIALLQLLLSIYGGYFGAGLGIMILAVLTIIGMDDIHAMNALKTLLASLVNSVAVIIFVIAGIVVWPIVLIMAVGAIIGGYAGADLARRLDRQLVRRFVTVVGFSITIVFFVREYLF